MPKKYYEDGTQHYSNVALNPASFNISGVSNAGIKITLPFNAAENIMLSFTVRTYFNYQPRDIQFSGYLLETGVWNFPKAYMLGGSLPTQVKMGLTPDGDGYVWMAGVSNHAGVAVYDVTLGLNGGDANEGWVIERSDDTPDVYLDTTIYPPLAQNGTAVNSDKLGDRSVSQFAIYNGRTAADLNTLRTSGNYGLESTNPNAPVGSDYASLIVASNSDTGLQIVGGYLTNRLWFRGWTPPDFTFYPWHEIYHTGNPPPSTLSSSGSNANGYYKIWTNGDRECWGRISNHLANEARTVNFPISMGSTSLQSIMATAGRASASGGVHSVYATTISSSQFRLAHDDTSDSNTTPYTMWYARGQS